MLRELRAQAGLTQEELAAAARLSPRSVSDLERGIHRTARQETARLLADALGLADRMRALFVSAARGHGPAAVVLAARHGEAPGAFQAAVTRTLPRDIAGFTGRQAELAKLMGESASMEADGGVVGIHAIGGMAGVGKTTFAVHAAHQLAAGFPDGQFFLPLHAHTPGQRPDLLMARRVIEHQQDLPVGHAIPPPGRACLQTGWDLRRRDPGGQ